MIELLIYVRNLVTFTNKTTLILHYNVTEICEVFTGSPGNPRSPGKPGNPAPPGDPDFPGGPVIQYK